MLEVPQEYGVCRSDDNLEDLSGEHGKECGNYLEEDSEGKAFDEPMCDLDNKPCKVGRVQTVWIGDPLPSEE